MSEVVVAGHICLDIFPTLTGEMVQFLPGQTIEAGPVVFSTGGSVSNTGLALHRLGIATQLMGKVGDDLFGQAILHLLETRGPGLAQGMIVAAGAESSYSIILSTPTADRMLIHAQGCNATFGATDVRYDLLAMARLFHFGYPPLMERMYAQDGAELAAIFQRVRAMGLTTSLDVSLPDPSSSAGRADWQAILSAALPDVDIFLPSALEILLMLRRPLFEQVMLRANPLDALTPAIVAELGQTLLEMGAPIIGLKLGDRGLYVRTAENARLEQIGRSQIPERAVWSTWAGRELWAPCFAVQAAGTTGSGDATIAGFLMGLLRGMTLPEAMAAACAVGACSVEAVDALSGLHDWDETAGRIAAGWPRVPLSLAASAPDWRWDDVHQLWVGPRDATRSESSEG